MIMGYVGICVIRANHVLSRLFKRSGRYLESETIHTPFIIGFIKPRICVPSSLDVNEKDYMLLHEHIHVKNHDALIKSFALMLLCLHWFNPFVWLAFRLAMSDLEMRCDEEVVDILGDRIRKEYCLSIVNHAVADNNFRVFTTAFAKKSIGRMEIKMTGRDRRHSVDDHQPRRDRSRWTPEPQFQDARLVPFFHEGHEDLDGIPAPAFRG